MGRPSETRQRGYESRETSCLGRVLPHLASFLAFRRVYNAILHIRFDQAQIPKCHPPFLSSVNAESLSPFLLFTLFSSSPTCSSSLSLSLSFSLSLITRLSFSVENVTKHHLKGHDQMSCCSSLSKMTHAQLSIVVTERCRCASPTAVRRHGNLHT